jgi:putative transposase
LTDLLEHLCVLYNQALSDRKISWEQEKKQINLYDQQKALTLFRKSSMLVKGYPCHIQRDPLNRVDLAFKAFFRRVRTGEAPGYPRFKPRSSYDSFTVCDGFKLALDHVIIPKLGGFRFKTRYKIKGEPKVLHVRRCGSHWIANLSCYVGEAPIKVAVSKVTGIDVGLTTLATLSDGSEISNPRWTKQEEVRLAEANRNLARKKRGSKNRLKAKETLRRVHQRIAGLRSNYLTGIAKQLVNEYDLIAHEDLKISQMVQSRYAKSILDAAWGQLVWKLNCEAEKAGKWVVPVNPRNTTKMCSGCGELVLKKIWQRVHNCPQCGLILGRDHNAALNILRLGQSPVSKQNILQVTS